jgi:hypothetical protein
MPFVPAFPSRDARRRLGQIAGASALAAAALVAGHVAAGSAPRAVAGPGLTVVELFTSQGCSSCPPANANLTRLAARPDVLALSFGVTYWDQLGWTDTFGSPVFTARQRAYQNGLANDNVWTPQVVVDGRADVVGQNLAEIERLIRAHRAFTGPTVAFRDGGVGLAGGATPTRPADVWLVRYDPRIVDVPVRRGENGGRTLPHVDVVRELVRIGGWNGRTVGFALPAPTRERLRTAVLVQAPDGGPIIAAGRL